MEESNEGVFYKTLSKEDFDEICRCCLSPAPLSIIFELIYEETSLVDVFNYVFGTKLDPEDDLPKKICETCISAVIHCYNFKKTYEASEAALQNIIAIKTEDVDTEIKVELPKDISEDLVQIQLDNEIIAESKERETYNKIEENPKQKVNIKEQNQSKVFRCSCEKTFTSKVEFRQHRESTKHHIPRTDPCKICGILFPKLGLQKHIKTHQGLKRYRCDHCGARFVSNSNLRRHLQIHTGDKPHVCEYCSKSFIQLYSLQVHKRIHTGEKPYLCVYCGKRFTEKDNCNVHMRTHVKQNSSVPKVTKNFVCDECGKLCRSPAAYKIHFYKKHGLGEGQVIKDDQHQCKICKKFYSSQSSLSFHMVRHNEKRFLCNECGKGFHTKNTLRLHATIHTGEKSYACEFCDKKFARPESLHTHRFTHTGEARYACHLCPKKFTQNSNLNRHLKVHSGEKPYVCDFCDKSFAMKDTLNTHVRSHTGEKPYKCDECAIMFCDVRSLNKHKKRMHQQS